jgi:tetratricopeptide (TPR) repeat protein
MANKLHREAMACLATAENLQPQEARWPYLQGMILLTWDAGAAIPKLQRGAELAAPHIIHPRLRLAHLLIERGRLEEASGYLQSVAATHASEPHVILGFGKVELARGKLEAALQHLERSASEPATARASQALIAAAQQRLGNADAAMKASALAESLPADPPMADVFLQETAIFISGLEHWLTQADRLLKAGRLPDAVALNERAVATYPHSATAWQRLGIARIEEGRRDAAIDAFRKALEITSGSSETHFQMGAVFFEQGDVAAAEESFRRSIEIRPNYAPAHYNVGLCLLRRNEVAGAIEAFRTAIRLEPTMTEAHKQLQAAEARKASL